jgi:hypothetical protein
MAYIYIFFFNRFYLIKGHWLLALPCHWHLAKPVARCLAFGKARQVLKPRRQRAHWQSQMPMARYSKFKKENGIRK